jgi:hypothetical protein
MDSKNNTTTTTTNKSLDITKRQKPIPTTTTFSTFITNNDANKVFQSLSGLRDVVGRFDHNKNEYPIQFNYLTYELLFNYLNTYFFHLQPTTILSHLLQSTSTTTSDKEGDVTLNKICESMIDLLKSIQVAKYIYNYCIQQNKEIGVDNFQNDVTIHEQKIISLLIVVVDAQLIASHNIQQAIMNIHTLKSSLLDGYATAVNITHMHLQQCYLELERIFHSLANILIRDDLIHKGNLTKIDFYLVKNLIEEMIGNGGSLYANRSMQLREVNASRLPYPPIFSQRILNDFFHNGLLQFAVGGIGQQFYERLEYHYDENDTQNDSYSEFDNEGGQLPVQTSYFLLLLTEFITHPKIEQQNNNSSNNTNNFAKIDDGLTVDWLIQAGIVTHLVNLMKMSQTEKLVSMWIGSTYEDIQHVLSYCCIVLVRIFQHYGGHDTVPALCFWQDFFKQFKDEFPVLVKYYEECCEWLDDDIGHEEEMLSEYDHEIATKIHNNRLILNNMKLCEKYQPQTNFLHQPADKIIAKLWQIHYHEFEGDDYCSYRDARWVLRGGYVMLSILFEGWYAGEKAQVLMSMSGKSAGKMI